MWEYKVITWVGNNLEVLLNEMGVQGWDLCGIREDDFIFKKNINTNTYTYYTVDPYYINPPSIITSKANTASGTIPSSSANSVSTTK